MILKNTQSFVFITISKNWMYVCAFMNILRCNISSLNKRLYNNECIIVILSS